MKNSNRLLQVAWTLLFISIALSFFTLYSTHNTVIFLKNIAVAEEQMGGNAMTIVALRRDRSVPDDKLDELTDKTELVSKLLQRAKNKQDPDALREAFKINSEVRHELDRFLNPYKEDD